MGMINQKSLGALFPAVMARKVVGANEEEQNPSIAKNTILRDRVNDEQATLAKQGPLMIRNPKKVAKGA